MSMKCPRCGRLIGLTARGLKLKDGLICNRCFQELGFDKSDRDAAQYLYAYEDIKDGKRAYYDRRLKQAIAESGIRLEIDCRGKERELNATDGEREVYRILRCIVSDLCFNTEPLRLVRVSDNYLTAKCGEWDLARFKFTTRAKWIWFPTKEEKRRYIEVPTELYSFPEAVKSSLSHIEKYSKV